MKGTTEGVEPLTSDLPGLQATQSHRTAYSPSEAKKFLQFDYVNSCLETGTRNFFQMYRHSLPTDLENIVREYIPGLV
jgi:hypothetical protein